MNMRKKEKIIRELDDESKSMAESARDIAEQLNLNLRTTAIIILAKRRKFDSVKDYRIDNLKKRGFNRRTEYLNYRAKKNHFENFREYGEYIAQINGFIDKSEYILYRYHKLRSNFKNKRDFQEREGLLEGLKYIDPKSLDNLSAEKETSLISILEESDKKEEKARLLEETLEGLKERWRRVIIGRFYEGKTLEEVGKALEITIARVEQLEKKALRKLYFLARRNGLYDLYIEN